MVGFGVGLVGRVSVKTAMVDNVKGVPARTRNNVVRWWSDSRTFLVEVRNELKRVTWPSKKEVYATTFVVILTSVFFGLYLWGIDLLLNTIVGWIFSNFGVA